MMNKLFKPSCLLMYLLVILVFFMAGITIAGVSGVAKGQGLAGGAIIFMYGAVTACIAFIVAIVIASKVSRKLIINLNKILAVLIVVFFSYFVIKYQAKQREKQELDNQKIKKTKSPAKTTTTANKEISMLSYKKLTKPTHTQQNLESSMGIGFYSPNYFEYPTLYFYGNINLEKGLTDHMPMDSIVFSKDKYNNPTTTYAPPWLYPEYLKLDYGIIVFKVLGTSLDFVKVEANSINHKNIYLDKFKGSFVSWSSFILSVHSVEFNENSSKKVFVKPLDYAGEINIEFSFMQPLLVEEEWMYVLLVDYSLKEQGKGWIRWKKDGKLLVSYSLLS